MHGPPGRMIKTATSALEGLLVSGGLLSTPDSAGSGTVRLHLGQVTTLSENQGSYGRKTLDKDLSTNFGHEDSHSERTSFYKYRSNPHVLSLRLVFLSIQEAMFIRQAEGCSDPHWHTSSAGGRRDAPSLDTCRIYSSYLTIDPSPSTVRGPVADPPRRSTSSDTSTEELSPALLGDIQQLVTAAILEQVVAIAPTRVATPSDVDAPEEEEGKDAPIPVPLADELPMNCRTPAIVEYDGTMDPMEHLSRFENAGLLHRYTDGIKYRVFVTMFTRDIQQWFNQLPVEAIGSFQEFRSLFLHQFASSRKLRKIELSLFAVQQKDNEPLKEYLQRFNAAMLEVLSATQEVKASAFSQGLLDGDFFKSLAKRPTSKFDALLARAAKYINMEDAQAAKKESRGEKRKETKEESPSKKPHVDTRDRKPPFQRVNAVYTPLTVPITQALMAVEGKWFLTRPRNMYAVKKPEEPGFIKNKETKQEKPRLPAPNVPPKKEPNMLQGEKERLMSPPPPKRGHTHDNRRSHGRDSHHARKSQVREAHDVSLKEVLDVEAMEDCPLIQFRRAERSGPRISHNDALVITALLANYEVGRIIIDSGSSADILFGEAYDQMQLGDISLEKVNTSLYGFAGEVVHPRGMVSLSLTMGVGVTRKTCMLKFLVVDVPSAYNVILGRPTLNAFQAGISTYHIKIKFPTPGRVGEVQGDPLQSRKCYVEAVRKGQKRTSDEAHKGVPPSEKGKDTCAEEAPEGTGAPAKVQPAEELLNIEIILGHPDKITRDLEGIDPKVITHDLNLDPSIKLVKQKKRHFGPEKDKIIRAEVDKLMTAGPIEEIQFPEWLSNVVLVPKPRGKWRMCIDFRDLHKACPKDFYPLPRIGQLVDSTSGCELLSMMDASQGYHQIMLAPEDRKKFSFITSTGTFCYVAMPF
ncbi:UNVERIFIED_CONTAM: hypothetical protein Slati_2748700 [Sesamum latifolium]|uniref:Retrotransposon gag domain-containing protein n=1 Tax=Sesamum latifolium TaxID=2727402 RepID=A0AAW2VYQ8_9LAMI